MKSNILNIILVAAFFFVSCNSIQKTPMDDHSNEAKMDTHEDEIVFTQKQAKAVGLKTEIVSPTSFRSIIKTSGQIQVPQADEQTIVATSAGVVSFTKHSITDGSSVLAGETLISISAKNLQKGDPVVKLKIAFDTAEKEYRRAKALVADKIISIKEFDQVRLRYQTLKAEYQGLSANITATGIRITSPISGYIKNRFVNQGEYVSVGQPIITVSQNKRLQLRAEVSESHFKALRNVSSANFKPAYDNNTYKLAELNGKLLSYGKTMNSKSFYIPIIFEFDNAGDIIPGSFTEVYLLLQPREGIISVPESSLAEEQGLNFVYIQIEPDAFKKQGVVIGQSNGERVEILTGLKLGEKVVTEGVIQIKLASSSTIIPDSHNH